MLNKSYKLLAIVLAFSVLFSCLPMSIVALDVPNENVALSDVNEPEAYSSDVIVEDESLREENVKHFRMPDGSYTAVIYTQPIHRKDSNGIWQDIDNSMTEAPVKNKQVFVTADGRTVFSKKINSNDPTVFELSENGYSIKVSFANADIKNTTAKLSNHAKKYTPTNADDIETQYKKLKTIDNNTTVAYKNLLKGMTLEYVLSANDIKENIIVEKTNDSYAYTFIYELTGLTAVLNDDGSIVLLDETEQMPVYKIPAPYMYDANNATSDNVSYALSDLENGTYELTVSADETWINSSERAFPVVIDPTIRPNDLMMEDTYISSVNPTTNYAQSNELWISSSQITYFKFNMPANITYENLKSANLYTSYYYYSGVNTGEVDVGAYRIDVDWNSNLWTWNHANEYSNYGCYIAQIDQQTLSAEIEATFDSPEWVAFNITSIARRWVGGLDQNNGVALKYLDSSSNYSVILNSSESEAHKCPYLVVTYFAEESQTITEGIYWISSRATNGASGNPRLMDVTGNSSNINTEIQQWDSSDPSANKYRAQLFYIKYLGNGYYRIHPFSNPNYCLKMTDDGRIVTDGVNENGQYKDETKWSIIGNSSDGYVITNFKDENSCIAPPSSVENGLALEMAPKPANYDRSIRWKFNKFEGYIMSIVVDPGGLNSGSETSNSGTGHGFLMIKNCSSKAVTIGYVTVLPEQCITIGTAGNLLGEGGSSGESMEGIFYNREAYHFVESNYYQTRVSLSIPIDNADLEHINENYLRNDAYNDWNLLFHGGHNCTWFAMNVWNSITEFDVNASSGDNGLIYTPWTLAASIKTYNWYTDQIEMPSTDWYGCCYMSADNVMHFKYIVGETNAYPSVDTDGNE